MTVIVIGILVVIIGCIIYLLSGDFSRRNVAVTVIESFPLPILKKWVKEDKNEKDNITVKEVDTQTNGGINKLVNEHNKIIDFEYKSDTLAKTGIAEVIDNNIESKAINTILDIEEISELTASEDNELEVTINDDLDIYNHKDIVLDENACDTLESEELVYWTPNGKTYHGKTTCRTLTRSKIINCGTINESGKDLKCEHCK